MNDGLAIFLILIHVACTTGYAFFIKISTNRLVLFGSLNLITIFFGLAFLNFVPPLPFEAWPFFVGSIVSYNAMLFFIAKAYHHHDLSSAGPLMTAIKYIALISIAATFFQEKSSVLGWGGILIVFMGILTQIDIKRLVHTQYGREYGYIALAAFASAAQVSFDILGIRACENPFTYIVWSMFLGVPVTAFALMRYGRSIQQLIQLEWKQIVLSCALDNIGYAAFLLVIYVLKVLYVLPLSNLTIVLMTLIGLFVLKEDMKARRIAGSLILFVGVALIQIARSAS